MGGILAPSHPLGSGPGSYIEGHHLQALEDFRIKAAQGFNPGHFGRGEIVGSDPCEEYYGRPIWPRDGKETCLAGGKIGEVRRH